MHTHTCTRTHTDSAMSTALGQHPLSIPFTEPVLHYRNGKPQSGAQSNKHTSTCENGQPPLAVKESKAESQENSITSGNSFDKEVESPISMTVCGVTGEGEEMREVCVTVHSEGQGQVETEEVTTRQLHNGKYSSASKTSLSYVDISPPLQVHIWLV